MPDVPRRCISPGGLSEQLGGARIYLKREDLLHTGAHKINNCIGQGLLARRMGKHRIIAETGAGQHGVATATVCALFGFDCTVYMGEEDMRRQRLNVFRMRLLGAKVVGVTNGSRTLKDAISEAMRDWVTNLSTHALPARLRAGPASVPADGSRLSPGHRRRERAGRFWSASSACPIGSSPAWAAAAMPSVCSTRLLPDAGVSADRHRGGRPRCRTGRARGSIFRRVARRSAWRLQLPAAGRRRPGIADAFHFGRLDYALIGPEHAWLHDQGRAEYVNASDETALDAATRLSRTEGIIPALESAHAVAEAMRQAPGAKGEIFVVNLPAVAIRIRIFIART